MGKIRIILAETEETVLTALELKFIYELRDTVELEVISSVQYFSRFFSVHQKADILVCGQELYSPELKRHDIDKVFLLCESISAVGTADLDVERVNKYSNPKIVMDQVLNGTKISSKKKEPIVAMVYSASGGTGKTTVALGVCAALAKDFKRVLYINAERLNTFQGRLKGTASMPNSLIPELGCDGDNIYQKIKHVIRKEGFDYLPPFSSALSALGLSFSVYEKIAMSAKRSGEYDVIVVDTDSVFDEYKASFLTKADRVLLVVNQKKYSVQATNALLSNMNCNDTSKYFFVCNAFDGSRPNALLATENKPKFVVSESVGYIENIEQLEQNELAARSDIQKAAYLLM